MIRPGRRCAGDRVPRTKLDGATRTSIVTPLTNTPTARMPSRDRTPDVVMTGHDVVAAVPRVDGVAGKAGGLL